MIGDCRTFVFLGLLALFFRAFLERSPELVATGGDSTSISIGEFVTPVECLPSNEAIGSF